MRFIVLTISLVFLIGCQPEPARKLTEQERVADMYWLFSKFDHNYAPRTLKEKLHGFDYERLKDKYLEEAKADQENPEFFQLMHKFIAEFKDAHTSGSIQISTLPGRSKIAYLGFSGVRDGKNLVVKKILPSIRTEDLNIIEKASAYPIKEGDIIMELDERPLFIALQEDILPYRNLGNDESNKSGLLNGLFTRYSHKTPMPKKDMALLKVKRGKREFEVEIPWVTKDFVTFREEQKEAIRKKAARASGDSEYDRDITEGQFEILKTMTELISRGLISFEKITQILSTEKDFSKIQTAFYQNMEAYDVRDNFRLPQEEYLWPMIGMFEAYFGAATDEKEKKTPFEELKEKRFVPEDSYPVEKAATFPAYITFKKNEAGEREMIGVINISTFNPVGNADDILKEYKATLKHFADFGVKKLVLDLIDNGGGSLELGYKMSQALTTKKIELAKIQYALNENWIDNFHSSSLNAAGDFEKEIARRTYVELNDQRDQGLKLSKPYSLHSLYPFKIVENTELMIDDKPWEFEVVLVTNELCASMCDIFTAMFSDNKLGKFIGTQTMGAGGNVTTHIQAPNSSLVLRQTESLFVRTNDEKSYIENNGIKPDIETEIMNERNKKFQPSMTKAFEVLVPGPKETEKTEEAEPETETLAKAN